MTVMAQEGHTLYQHPGLRAAMRIMANRTALPDRLMLDKEWAALFRVALITGFIDRVLGQIAPGPAMRIVTI